MVSTARTNFPYFRLDVESMGQIRPCDKFLINTIVGDLSWSFLKCKEDLEICRGGYSFEQGLVVIRQSRVAFFFEFIWIPVESVPYMVSYN